MKPGNMYKFVCVRSLISAFFMFFNTYNEIEYFTRLTQKRNVML